jgi:hypothetical protein
VLLCLLCLPGCLPACHACSAPAWVCKGLARRRFLPLASQTADPTCTYPVPHALPLCTAAGMARIWLTAAQTQTSWIAMRCRCLPGQQQCQLANRRCVCPPGCAPGRVCLYTRVQLTRSHPAVKCGVHRSSQAGGQQLLVLPLLCALRSPLQGAGCGAGLGGAGPPHALPK